MNNYHEPHKELSKETKNYTRALNSMKEEIEAVVWVKLMLYSLIGQVFIRQMIHTKKYFLKFKKQSKILFLNLAKNIGRKSFIKLETSLCSHTHAFFV